MLIIWLNAEICNREECQCLYELIPLFTLGEDEIKNRTEIDTAKRHANEFSNIIAAINVGNEVLIRWNDHMIL